jgi:hypothetical protein
MHVAMRDPQRAAVADRLTLGCGACGITMRELAMLAGLPRQRLDQISLGRSPIAPWVLRLAGILACDPRWLEHGRGAPPPWATTSPRNSRG